MAPTVRFGVSLMPEMICGCIAGGFSGKSAAL
jgi:hypothetical protein